MNWAEYEQYKAWLRTLNLTPDQYEKAIREYLRKHE